MGDYAFLTTWRVDAPIEEVYDLIKDAPGYPRWWKGAEHVEQLVAGDERGVGRVHRYRWRGTLPYVLEFQAQVTRVEPPYLIEAGVTGQLDGVGAWRLSEGDGTAVAFSWRVRTTPGWMNVLGPVARPAFTWSHDRLMARGGAGLARELDARARARR